MVGDINVFITANVAGLDETLKRAGGMVRSFGQGVRGVSANVSQGFNNWSNEIVRFGDKMVKERGRVTREMEQTSRSMLVIGAAGAAGMVLAVKTFADFEKEMRNVASISDEVAAKGDVAFKRMSKSVREMALTLPQSAADLAKGLYDIVSSGFDGADALHILGVAAQAASAGLSTTKEAARAIVGTMNAYGMAAGEAQHVSDVWFQTVKVGVVSFEELAQHMGQFIGLAARGKVPIEQVGAAYATMTRAGLGASEASTSLARTIDGFIKPSEAFAKKAREMGYSSAYAMLQNEGLHGSIKKVFEATQGDVVETAKLFNEKRQLRGVLSLMAGDMDLYNTVMKTMTDRENVEGSTSRALAEQKKSLAFQMKLTANMAREVAMEFGESLVPAAQAALKVVGGVARTFHDMNPVMRNSIGGFALVGTTFVGLVGGMTLFAIKLAAARIAMNDLAQTSPRLANALNVLSGGAIKPTDGALLHMSRSAEIARTAIAGLFQVAAAGVILYTVASQAENMFQAFQKMKIGKENIEDLTTALIKLGEGVDTNAAPEKIKQLFAEIEKNARFNRTTLKLKTEDLLGWDPTELRPTMDNARNAVRSFVGIFGDSTKKNVESAEKWRERMRAAFHDVDTAISGLVKSGGVTQIPNILKGLSEASGIPLKEFNNILTKTSAELQVNKVRLELAAAGGDKFAKTAIEMETTLEDVDAQTKIWNDRIKGLGKTLQDFVDPSSIIKGIVGFNKDQQDIANNAEKAASKISTSSVKQRQAILNSIPDANDIAKKERAVQTAQARLSSVMSKPTKGGPFASMDTSRSAQVISATNSLKNAQDGLTETTGKVTEKQAEFNRLTGDSADPVGDAKIAVDDYLESLKGAPVDLDQFMQHLQLGIDASANWVTNLETLATRAGEAGIDPSKILQVRTFLESMGLEGQQVLEQLVSKAGPGQFRDYFEKLASAAAQGSDEFVKSVDTRLVVKMLIASGKVGTSVKSMQDKIAEMGLNVPASLTDIKAALEGLGFHVDSAFNVMPMDEFLKRLANIRREFAAFILQLADWEKKYPGATGRTAPGGGNFQAAEGAVVYPMARGGVVAHIQRGTRIQYGEPETQGEAYIPLATTKRSRSMQILTHVAHAFQSRVVPMAEGGVIPPQMDVREMPQLAKTEERREWMDIVAPAGAKKRRRKAEDNVIEPYTREIQRFYAQSARAAEQWGTKVKDTVKASLRPGEVREMMNQIPREGGRDLTRLATEAGRGLKDTAKVARDEVQAHNFEFIQSMSRTMSQTRSILELGGAAAMGALTQRLQVGRVGVVSIAGSFGRDLLGALNPVIVAAGRQPLAPGQAPSAITAAVGGVVERHVAQIAAGQTPYRVWAEPETGGEAYIPLAMAKRARSLAITQDVASRFGFHLVPKTEVNNYYATGAIVTHDHQKWSRPRLEGAAPSTERRSAGRAGFFGGSLPARPVHQLASGAVLPQVPVASFQPFGTKGYVGAAASKQTKTQVEIGALQKVKEMQAQQVADSGGGIGGGAIDQGWSSITKYLSGKGVSYVITSTTGGNHVKGSYHYRGKAVDLSGSAAMMSAMFDSLAQIGGSLAELFYDPKGWFIKNGQRVKGAIGGHSDHVHAATFRIGGIAERTRDRVVGTWRGAGLRLGHARQQVAVRHADPRLQTVVAAPHAVVQRMAEGGSGKTLGPSLVHESFKDGGLRHLERLTTHDVLRQRRDRAQSVVVVHPGIAHYGKIASAAAGTTIEKTATNERADLRQHNLLRVDRTERTFHVPTTGHHVTHLASGGVLDRSKDKHVIDVRRLHERITSLVSHPRDEPSTSRTQHNADHQPGNRVLPAVRPVYFPEPRGRERVHTTSFSQGGLIVHETHRPERDGARVVAHGGRLPRVVAAVAAPIRLLGRLHAFIRRADGYASQDRPQHSTLRTASIHSRIDARDESRKLRSVRKLDLHDVTRHQRRTGRFLKELHTDKLAQRVRSFNDGGFVGLSQPHTTEKMGYKGAVWTTGERPAMFASGGTYISRSAPARVLSQWITRAAGRMIAPSRPIPRLPQPRIVMPMTDGGVVNTTNAGDTILNMARGGVVNRNVTSTSMIRDDRQRVVDRPESRQTGRAITTHNVNVNVNQPLHMDNAKFGGDVTLDDVKRLQDRGIKQAKEEIAKALDV